MGYARSLRQPATIAGEKTRQTRHDSSRTWRQSLCDDLDGEPLRAGEVADVRRRDGTKQVGLAGQPVSIMGADRLSGAGQDGGKARGSQTAQAGIPDGLPTPVLKQRQNHPDSHVTHLHHSAAWLPGDRRGHACAPAEEEKWVSGASGEATLSG